MSREDEPPASAPRATGSLGGRRPWLPLLVIVVVFALLELSGARAWVQLDALREWVARAGAWGPVLFMAVFVVSVVLAVPGMVFVLSAPALFPAPAAFFVVLVGGNLAANASFLLVRRLGGQPLDGLSGPGIVRRAFAQLHHHPLRAITVIRFAVLLFPPVTAALALTSVRLRDHALGTALAVTPVFATIVGLEVLTLG